MDIKPRSPKAVSTDCVYTRDVVVPKPEMLAGFRCKPSSHVICRPCAERFDQRKKII